MPSNAYTFTVSAAESFYDGDSAECMNVKLRRFEIGQGTDTVQRTLPPVRLRLALTTSIHLRAYCEISDCAARTRAATMSLGEIFSDKSKLFLFPSSQFVRLLATAMRALGKPIPPASDMSGHGENE